MKLNKFALTLATAALLPTFAYAATDEVAASFERDLQRSTVIESIIAKSDADPLVDALNVAFYGTTDPILASFERDLDRTPAAIQSVMLAGAADPLVEALNIALYGTTDQVLASFERDLNRELAV